MPTTFAEAIADKPVNSFQLITAATCMAILMCEGIDIQLLGIVAPAVRADFGVDKGTFGIAMSAALVGMAFGAWFGGVIGDRIGRRYSLALAAFAFGLATIVASRAGGVWSMAGWRLLGGLGFGCAFANALAMTSEWLPPRWRALSITCLSVGTPAGGAIAGALAPALLQNHDWRGLFVIFGLATLLLVGVVLALLRDSPPFLLAKGRDRQASDAAAKMLGGSTHLVPDSDGASTPGAAEVGVLNRANLRLNLGVGFGFTACTVVAYAILNWSTTLLTAKGFSLASASYAISLAGAASVAGSLGAGLIVRQIGSRAVLVAVGGALAAIMAVLAFQVEHTVSGAEGGIIVISLIAAAAAVFSAGIATVYVIITLGYPQSCRSAGIGFGIFMGRVGAIAASGFGGTLLEIGRGSTLPFFAVLIGSCALISGSAFVIDRHTVPYRKEGRYNQRDLPHAPS